MNHLIHRLIAVILLIYVLGLLLSCDSRVIGCDINLNSTIYQLQRVLPLLY
jgi:hypothetical protein